MNYSQYQFYKKNKNRTKREIALNYINEKFDGSVPVIQRRPELDDYGLPQKADEKFKADFSRYEKRVRTIGAVGIFVICWFVMMLLLCKWMPDKAHLDDFALWAGCAFPALIAMVIGVELFYDTFTKRAESQYYKTPFAKSYLKYKDDLYAYIYWQEINSISFWKSLNGHEFERAVAAKYSANGFQTTVTKGSGDGGIDLLIYKDGIGKIPVQCKAWKKKVGPAVVRELYGVMQANDYDNGIVVSLSGFSTGAYDFARNNNVKLVSLDDILSNRIY